MMRGLARVRGGSDKYHGRIPTIRVLHEHNVRSGFCDDDMIAATQERAGYPGRILHDLRRSAVRNMERAGLSRSVAMQWTGHKTEAVYRRYAIPSERDLREGVDRSNHAAWTNRMDNRGSVAKQSA